MLRLSEVKDTLDDPKFLMILRVHILLFPSHLCRLPQKATAPPLILPLSLRYSRVKTPRLLKYSECLRVRPEATQSLILPWNQRLGPVGCRCPRTLCYFLSPQYTFSAQDGAGMYLLGSKESNSIDEMREINTRNLRCVLRQEFADPLSRPRRVFFSCANPQDQCSAIFCGCSRTFVPSQ